jgi:thioesterase domain-containing protein/acyl carrier protein
VLDIWALVLGHRDIGLDDDFFLVGGDSLQAVELFKAIEEHLRRVLPEATVLEANTVRAMTRTIANEDPAGSLVAFRSSGSRPPLFLAHHGGGHVLGYRTLANLLDPDQPVFAFQAVGLDGSSDPLGSIEEMAARYVEELRRIQPRGPYQVGGFSFGGRVAYVMAQMLREAGEDVHLLALIDSYSFHGIRLVPTKRRVERKIRKFFALPLKQRWHWIVEGVLRNLKGVLRSRILVPLYRTTYWFYRRRSRPLPRFLRRAKLANSMAGLAYRAEPYQGDALLFRGYLPPNMHSDMHESWRRLVQGRLDVVDLPGTHEEVLLEPIVRIVAKQLEARLMQRVDSGF